MSGPLRFRVAQPDGDRVLTEVVIDKDARYLYAVLSPSAVQSVVHACRSV
jgi:hypothetical protein